MFTKPVISEEGWDVTQVAPPPALTDGFITTQAAVLLSVPRVPWERGCVPALAPWPVSSAGWSIVQYTRRWRV